MFTDLGISDDDIYLSDTYTTRMTGTTIAYALGYKEISSTPDGEADTILMPIVIRGTGYEREWYSNMSIGENGEHEGFGSAADTVYAGVQKYVNEHKSEWGNKTVKYWVVGYSRAAGVANLTGRRVIDGLHNGELSSDGDAYIYTFGTPKGGRQDYVDKATAAGYDYNSIHNIVNAADVIIVFAPSDMGFIRYGLDHYVPGSGDTNQRNSDSKSWTFNGSTITPASSIYDNTIWNMNSNEYKAQKEKMLQQLAAIDYCEEGETCVYQEFLEADNKGFVAAKFNIFNVLSGGSYLQEFKGRTGYDDAELTLEQFLVIFVRYIEAFGLYNDQQQPSSTDTLRNLMASYQTDVSSLSPDEGLEVFAGYLKGMTDEESKKFSNCFSGLTSRFQISELFTFYMNYLAYYWPYQSAESRKAHLQTLWEKFVSYEVTDETTGEKYSILSVFTGSQDESTDLGIELKESFFVMFDLLLRFIAVDNMTYTGTGEKEDRSDYNGDTYYKDASGNIYHVNFVENVADNEFTQNKYGLSCLIMLGTLLRNSFFLPLNHHPELTFAWVRSYDTYYQNDTGKDKQVPTIKYDGELTITPTVNTNDSCVYSGSDNNYYGDCTLSLTSNKVGTVLLYRVNFNGEESKDNHYTTYKLYRGPIDLNYNGEYKVEIKAYYLGKLLESDPTTITYNIVDAPISINGVDVTSKVYSNTSTSETVAYLNADYLDTDNYKFIKWNSFSYNGTTVVLNDDVNKLLSLPIEAKFSYARDYSADYAPLIKNVDITFEENSATPTFSLNKYGTDTPISENINYSIAYRKDDDTHMTVIITLNEDSTNGIYFSNTTTGNITNKNTYVSEGELSIVYDSTCSTLTLSKQYEYESIEGEFYMVKVNYVDANYPDEIINSETFVMNKASDPSSQLPITIYAKELEGKQFSNWLDSNRGEISDTATYTISKDSISFTPSDSTYSELYAYYKPLVTNVSGTIADLKEGESLPTSISDGTATIYGQAISISGTITWERYDQESGWSAISEDEKVKPNTGYRATITPSFPEGTSIMYAYNETLTATINGKNLSSVDIVYSDGKPTLKFIMATNKKSEDDKSLVQVYDNSIVRLSRSQNSKDAILEVLANTTAQVLLANGDWVNVSVNWDDFTFKPSLDDQIIIVEGNVEGVENPSGVSTKVTQKFIIPGLPAMSSPVASVDSGTYDNSVSITLSADPGATIYYTKDGTDPSTSSTRIKYEGETITFKYTGKTGKETGAIEPQLLMAYVEGDGINYKDSDIVTYIYTITYKNDDSNPSSKPCEEAIGPDWTWSVSKNTCVYKVRNTSSIR